MKKKIFLYTFLIQNDDHFNLITICLHKLYLILLFFFFWKQSFYTVLSRKSYPNKSFFIVFIYKRYYIKTANAALYIAQQCINETKHKNLHTILHYIALSTFKKKSIWLLFILYSDSLILVMAFSDRQIIRKAIIGVEIFKKKKKSLAVFSSLKCLCIVS